MAHVSAKKKISLTWRHTGGGNGEPAGRPDIKKSPFYGLCASVFAKQRGLIPKSGGRKQKNGGLKVLHPRFRAFSGALWDVAWFWGGQTGIVLEIKPPKKGCFFHSIDVFGIVFGMSKEGSELA